MLAVKIPTFYIRYGENCGTEHFRQCCRKCSRFIGCCVHSVWGFEQIVHVDVYSDTHWAEFGAKFADFIRTGIHILGNSPKAIRTMVRIGVPSRASYDVTDFDEFAESGMVGNLWQCCLPFLRKKTIMVNQMRRRVLPGNVAETCFLLQKRNEENVSIISFCRSAQPRSWPSLLRRISAPWRLAHPPAVMACFTEAVSNWTVIQFSNWHSGKTIEGLRYDSAYHRRYPAWAFKS